MKNKLGKFFLPLLALVLFSFPGPVSGQELPRGKWWRLPRVQKALELTPEEQQTLDDLFLKSHLNLIELKAELEKERLKLENRIESDPLDETAVMQQHQKLEEARTALATERFKIILEVRKLLGPDRFQELKTKFREFRKTRGRDYRGRRKPAD